MAPKQRTTDLTISLMSSDGPSPSPVKRISWLRRAPVLVGIALVVQASCAAFFVYRILTDLLGLGGAPMSWFAYELIEVGAALGLILGLALGALALKRGLNRAREAEGRLAELSGAFHELVQDRFGRWGLTAAERDVAFFVLKGFSTAEIAKLRQTSEGTVKAQTAAIYRKAEVNGRAQLVSLFIDDLLNGHLTQTVDTETEPKAVETPPEPAPAAKRKGAVRKRRLPVRA